MYTSFRSLLRKKDVYKVKTIQVCYTKSGIKE